MNLWNRGPGLPDGAKRCPRSRAYRRELEPLVGAVVRVECPDYELLHGSPVPGAVELMLKRPQVVKAPASRKVDLPIELDRLRVLVDRDWPDRVPRPSPDAPLKMKAFVRKHVNSAGRVNIGLRVLSADYK